MGNTASQVPPLHGNILAVRASIEGRYQIRKVPRHQSSPQSQDSLSKYNEFTDVTSLAECRPASSRRLIHVQGSTVHSSPKVHRKGIGWMTVDGSSAALIPRDLECRGLQAHGVSSADTVESEADCCEAADEFEDLPVDDSAGPPENLRTHSGSSISARLRSRDMWVRNVRANSPRLFPAASRDASESGHRDDLANCMRSGTAGVDAVTPAQQISISESSPNRYDQQDDGSSLENLNPCKGTSGQNTMSMRSCDQTQRTELTAAVLNETSSRTNGADRSHNDRPSAELLCPLSPNSALGCTTPTTNATTAVGTSEGSLADSKSVGIYGAENNCVPFLEGNCLRYLLPLLFGRSLMVCTMVCPHWFMRICSGLTELFAPVTEEFSSAYSDFVEVWTAIPKLMPLQTTDGNGVRFDWVIIAKVLAKCANTYTHIGYSFKYLSDTLTSEESLTPLHTDGLDDADDTSGASRSSTNRSSVRSRTNAESTDYYSSRNSDNARISARGRILRPTEVRNRTYSVGYTFATCRSGSGRTLWVHRDICRFHGDETGAATISSLGPICVGDFIEVAVAACNGYGAVDLSSIHWKPPVQHTRIKPYYGIAAAEACPIEEDHRDWFTADQFRRMTTERIRRADCFAPHLIHQNTEYTGIDVAIRRSEYRTGKEGLAPSSLSHAWGIDCEVLPASSPVVFPLTRCGLQHDRIKILQLRQGDTVFYYLSQGGSAT